MGSSTLLLDSDSFFGQVLFRFYSEIRLSPDTNQHYSVLSG
jgi:hypothetical protein